MLAYHNKHKKPFQRIKVTFRDSIATNYLCRTKFYLNEDLRSSAENYDTGTSINYYFQ